MVTQCNNCQTRFKFDETLIEGEGIWVRCNQCKNVFFLENPARAGKTAPGDEGKDIDQKDVKESSLGQKNAEAKGVMKKQLEDRMGRETVSVMGMEKEAKEIDQHKPAEAENVHDERPDLDDTLEDKTPEKRVKSRGRQLVYLFMVLLIGGVYLTFFAETGWQTAFEQIFGASKKSEEVGPAQVDLADVRQRIVSNLTMGQIRVLEGTAINRSAFPMTRIKVKGEVTDAYTVVLGVRESYCGNLLNADELATMTEDQIQKELSNPQGSDVSNDRILPLGHIPFMVVFTREPAGVVKTFVTPVGAERLLP
jgi:predicted Zn finger-like uncharacterized protein